MEKYISFIVPVYNVENYLRQCIDSLLRQDIARGLYEIILVDDGSTDLSGKICDEYEAKYENVRSFHKENGGLSDARNYGLKKAAGRYILFVDSDDYICENILGTIVRECKKQKEPQVVFLMGQKLFPDGSVKQYDAGMDTEALQGSHKEVVSYLSERNAYPASACLKMVKQELLKKYGILFKTGMLSEDYEWSLMVFLNATSYGCCNENYYLYRQKRSGSITNEVSEKHVRDLIQIIQSMELIAKERQYQEYSEAVLKFSAYIYRCLLWNSFPYYKKYESEIKRMRYLLSRKNSKEIQMIRISEKLIGIKNTVRLLHMYRKVRK